MAFSLIFSMRTLPTNQLGNLQLHYLNHSLHQQWRSSHASYSPLSLILRDDAFEVLSLAVRARRPMANKVALNLSVSTALTGLRRSLLGAPGSRGGRRTGFALCLGGRCAGFGFHIGVLRRRWLMSGTCRWTDEGTDGLQVMGTKKV